MTTTLEECQRMLDEASPEHRAFAIAQVKKITGTLRPEIAVARQRRDVRLIPRSIYFIQAGESGPIKIGSAERLTALQTASPEPLRLLAVMDSVGVMVETEMHRKFAPHRLRGEWFSPAPELLAHIESVKSGDYRAPDRGKNYTM